MRSGWERVSISDVCHSIVDCPNRTAPTVDVVTPYKMIRTTNVKSGWIDLSSVKYVDEPTYRRWTRRQVPQRGDVILTREAPLGEVGMLRSNEHVFLGQRLVSYRADLSKLDPAFLLYSLCTDDLKGQIRAFGSGSTVEHMRVPDAKRLMLTLPPLPTQQRIAAILSAYDDLIENNTRRIVILEEMARRLYEEWFVHFRFPGHEEAEFDGELPKGWSIGQLSDIAALVGRSMNPGNLPDQTYAHFSFPAFDVSAAPEVVRGEAIMSNKLQFTGPVVLLAKLNPRIERVWPVLQDHEAPMVASTEFVPLAPREGSSVSMIEAVVRSRGFRDYLLGLAGGTSTSHQRVKPKEILAAQVPLAPPELWARSSVALDPLLSQRDALRRKNANLRAQRDMLLPKLISGEIDVSGAEELLEAAE